MLMSFYISDWIFFFFSSRRRHTRSTRDWSSDVCSSDLCSGSGASALADELHHRWRRIQRCGDGRGTGRLSVREFEVLQTDQSRGPAHYLAAQRRAPAAGALTEPGKVHPAQDDGPRG